VQKIRGVRGCVFLACIVIPLGGCWYLDPRGRNGSIADGCFSALNHTSSTSSGGTSGRTDARLTNTRMLSLSL
jgi:hypothetical protein